MDIQQRKYSLIQWLVNLDDPTLLSRLEEICKQSSSDDWASDLSEEERNGLQKGVNDLEQGEHYSYEEIREGIREKFNI